MKNKSYTILEEWQASASEIIPKKNNPATFCWASLILGHAQNSFPIKIPAVGKCRQSQDDHPVILRKEKWESEPGLQSASFTLKVFTHNSMHSGGIQLLSQSSPRLFTIALVNFLLQPVPTPSQ